ncbi:hypothetical protein BN1211_3298 [Cyberlindnera jadinii]|uniref:Uncharacterized protein n=1 Tax=Cyberlindnera jadinii (strain ATCC 18201 / CBS 1600 / BCRC 20928 / JCM 3617 / NBRC 0987 / NRRL Y-1542) TaxID=983966 RepID=A0A0H5C432_CYBJN|nr:hypothetical protein BN1211_3298 [Cyberlindnera jadinii]
MEGIKLNVLICFDLICPVELLQHGQRAEERAEDSWCWVWGSRTDDVVIKTPKQWLPVSQDPGALITEERSQMNSPLMYRRFGVDMDDPYFNNYGDDMDVNVEHPRTPRTTFEPVLNSGNRSIVSAKASPNKKRKRIKLAKYDGDDSDVYGDDYDEDDEDDGDGDGDDDGR